MVNDRGELGERIESLEDEFNLLKTEVRQTLVDLKEFIMKGRTILPENPPITNRSPLQETVTQEPRESPQTDELIPSLEAQPPDGEPETLMVSPEPNPTESAEFQRTAGFISSVPAQAGPAVAQPDATMMNNLIWWLGMAKRRGITLRQLSPFIEAYEMSGYMSPMIAKLIYRTMAEMESSNDASQTAAQMPQDFSEGLMQLNDIICSPEHALKRGDTFRDPLDSGTGYARIGSPDQNAA